MRTAVVTLVPGNASIIPNRETEPGKNLVPPERSTRKTCLNLESGEASTDSVRTSSY
jgi:hypothetical protein